MRFLAAILGLCCVVAFAQTRETFSVGNSANDGTGDSLRSFATKVSNNESNLFLTIFTNGVPDHIQVVDNVAALVALDTTNREFVRTLGYYVPGDGGSGFYRLTNSTPAGVSTNYGSWIKGAGATDYWSLVIDDTINIKQFGAVGDGVADDTDRVNDAIDYAVANSLGNVKTLLIPNGQYRVEGPLVLEYTSGRSLNIIGQGQQNSIIEQTDETSPTFVCTGYRGRISDLRITYTSASTSPHANGILFTSRESGIRNASYWTIERVTIKNAGTGITKTPNTTRTISVQALAGATNIVVSSVSGSTGQIFYREAEILIDLASGGVWPAIIQGTSGNTVTFLPALPSDSATAGGDVETPTTSHNNTFNSIWIDGAGYGLIRSQSRSSGDTWIGSIYASSRYDDGSENANELASGVGMLFEGHANETITGQINVEWIKVSRSAIAMTGRHTAVGNIHIEGVYLTGEDSALVEAREDVTIQSIHAQNYTVEGTNTAAASIFRVRDATLNVDSLVVYNATLIENWDNSGGFFLVNDTGDAPSSIHIKNRNVKPSAGLRDRFLVTPTDRHISLREYGNVIPPGVIGFRRNLRIDQSGDQAIYLHNKGIPRRMIVGNATKSPGAIPITINSATGGSGEFLPESYWLDDMSDKTKRVEIEFGIAPLLDENFYMRSTTSPWTASATSLSGSSVSRQRYMSRGTFLYNILEIVWDSAHGLNVGDLVSISNAGETAINGYNYEVVEVPSSTTFRIFSQGEEYASTADTGITVNRPATIDVIVYGEQWANMFDFPGDGATAGDHGFGQDVVRSKRVLDEAYVHNALIVEPGGVTSDVESTAIASFRSTSKGILPPRMTTAQRTAISSAADGLLVWDSDFDRLAVRDNDNTTWELLGQPQTETLTTSGGTVTITGANRAVWAHYWAADGDANIAWSGLRDGSSGTLLIYAAATNVSLTMPSYAYSAGGSPLTVTGGSNNFAVLAWESRTINSTNVVMVNLGNYEP